MDMVSDRGERRKDSKREMVMGTGVGDEVRGCAGE